MLSYEIITNLHETMIDIAVSQLLYKSYYLCLYRFALEIVELMTVYNRLRRSVWQRYSAYLLK